MLFLYFHFFRAVSWIKSVNRGERHHHDVGFCSRRSSFWSRERSVSLRATCDNYQRRRLHAPELFTKKLTCAAGAPCPHSSPLQLLFFFFLTSKKPRLRKARAHPRNPVFERSIASSHAERCIKVADEKPNAEVLENTADGIIKRDVS